MKNQNDLIAMIVCFVLTIIVVVLCFTVFQRQPVAPTPPATVVVTRAALPANPPVMAASLPQGSSKAGGPGGMPSFGGPGGAGAGPSMASGPGKTGPGGRPANKPMPAAQGAGG